MDRIRVLVADDEALVRESLVRVLESDPSLEVIGVAPDAQGAIDLAASRRPDVALVDVRMPGGGPRAAREIAQRCPPTRVLALSAFENREAVLEMIRAGARGYVGKHVTNVELLAAVHRTVEGTRELTPSAMHEVFRAFAEAVADQPPPPDPTGPRDRILRIIGREAVDFAFQPIGEIDTLRVTGVEAFARFRTRPRRPPHVWLEEAERLGLRRDLELTTVLAALRYLERIPADCYLALKLSDEVARSPELVELVRGWPCHRVVLELSERAMPVDDEQPTDALGELRGRGVRMAVDAGSTGFPGMRHVFRLSPDLIKLDASITRGIQSDDPTRQALAGSLVALARRIGASVVANGVETERELQLLRQIGVRWAQGYYLARPSRLPDPGRPWGRTTFGPSGLG